MGRRGPPPGAPPAADFHPLKPQRKGQNMGINTNIGAAAGVALAAGIILSGSSGPSSPASSCRKR